MRNKTRESLGFCSRKSLKRFFRRIQNEADEIGVLSALFGLVQAPYRGLCRRPEKTVEDTRSHSLSNSAVRGFGRRKFHKTSA
jgi:hypothetical protein